VRRIFFALGYGKERRKKTDTFSKPTRLQLEGLGKRRQETNGILFGYWEEKKTLSKPREAGGEGEA